MKKLVLLSFANSIYAQSLERIKTETECFPFTERYFYTELDFPEEFRKQLHNKKYRRGYGYWRWKSYLVKKTLNSLNDNDIIIWTDAGNFWNIKGKKRFEEYLNFVEKIESGIVVFEQPFLEKDYTKGDLLEYLDVYKSDEIVMSLQLWGGCFILRKTPCSIAFVEEWEAVHSSCYDLITDKKSNISNLNGFIEHRHDQSSFSVIVKKYVHLAIPYNEVYDIRSGWENMSAFPIQGRRLRHKDRTLWKKIKEYLLLPYRCLLGLYLIIFENMYFKNKFWY
ncbi:hypothetical protein [Bacteroides xylanisolvens]|uniref:hypothetical protein n=1 Tax=Bacteroides xylanisolvens TaxID=371601 RepID=UPI0022EA31F7|nr:hypothetical protein [Bacteroides xylanisolvens]